MSVRLYYQTLGAALYTKIEGNVFTKRKDGPRVFYPAAMSFRYEEQRTDIPLIMSKNLVKTIPNPP